MEYIYKEALKEMEEGVIEYLERNCTGERPDLNNLPPAELEKLAEAGDDDAMWRLGFKYQLGRDGLDADYEKAAVWYNKGADRINPKACFLLGMLYSVGKGVERDERQMVQLWLYSAVRNFGPAEYWLGRLYFSGCEILDRDYVLARNYFNKAALHGEYDGLAMLGVCRAQGKGVEKDKDEGEWMLHVARAKGSLLAAKLLSGLDDKGADELAELLDNADAGDTLAMMELASRFAGGRGFPKDEEKALFWMQKAAGCGNPVAQYYVGEHWLSVDEPEKGLHWLEKSAGLGYPKAQSHLGILYYEGNVVEQDFGKAVELYRKAAEAGDVDGEYNLGICYLGGQGVAEDLEEAIRWHRKAAGHGLVGAMLSLGIAYFFGKGAPQDYVQAVQWLEKASEGGSPQADKLLGKCYWEGYGVERDERKAYEHELTAAESGDTDAMTMVAYFHSTGTGTEQNEEAATQWYLKAAKLGNADAQFHYGMRLLEQTEEEDAPKELAEEAARWLRAAGEAGHYDAVAYLGVCYYEGIAGEDRGAGLDLVSSAAAHGSLYGYFYLGSIYRAEDDPQHAMYWLKKAADEGLEDARRDYEELRSLGYRPSPNPVKDLFSRHDEQMNRAQTLN